MESKAKSTNVQISTKKSVEICNMVRNKSVDQAKKILMGVIEGTRPVPYKRYNKDTPHKAGSVSAARSPVGTVMQILNIIKSAESNALQKGSSDNLYISHISAHKASIQFHYGRKRSRRRKSTNLDIIVSEKADPKKSEKKVEQKTESKKEIKEPKKEIKTKSGESKK